MRMLIKKSLGRHDKAWCAESALLRVVINESLLDGIKFAGLAQAFNGRDLRALRIDGQNRAGIDGFAVQMDGAGAAGPAIAHALGSGQVKLIAQRVQQRDSRLQLCLELLAVDIEGHRNLAGTVISGRHHECQRAGMADQRNGR